MNDVLSFMKVRLQVFIAVFLMACSSAWGQHLYRISGSFSTKIQTPDGKGVLTMGSFYYDKNASQLVYNVHFPEKEVWVYKDSLHYVYKNGVLTNTLPSPVLLNLTVFHLSLNSQLTNYGLEQTVFKLKEVKQDGDLVISDWINTGKGKMGRLSLSTKNRKLHGVIFYDAKGKVLRKQFYSNYQQVKDISFPLEIVDLFYSEKGESIQKTTYKNIMINEKGNNDMYYYNPSVGR